MTVRFSLGALALTVLVSLGASGPASSTSPEPQVLIKSFAFSPASLTVKVGSSVTWANKDQEPHSVVNQEGAFRSGALDTEETYTFKFDKPGVYHYACSFHPQMTATVTVQ